MAAAAQVNLTQAKLPLTVIKGMRWSNATLNGIGIGIETARRASNVSPLSSGDIRKPGGCQQRQATQNEVAVCLQGPVRRGPQQHICRYRYPSCSVAKSVECRLGNALESLDALELAEFFVECGERAMPCLACSLEHHAIGEAELGSPAKPS